jgi:hypothetical protein
MDFVYVSCQATGASAGWHREYRYPIRGPRVQIDLILLTGDEGVSMMPGTYVLIFHLNVPVPGGFITAHGRIVHR